MHDILLDLNLIVLTGCLISSWYTQSLKNKINDQKWFYENLLKDRDNYKKYYNDECKKNRALKNEISIVRNLFQLKEKDLVQNFPKN